MWLSCQRGCNCARGDAHEFMEESDAVVVTEGDKDEQFESFNGKLRCKGGAAWGDAAAEPSPAAAATDSTCAEGGSPLPPASPQTWGASEPEPKAAGACEEERSQAAPFVPLDEDKPIFELDAQRLQAATQHLASFRERVEAELLQGPLGQSPSAADQPSGALTPQAPEGPEQQAARRFCSDATLLRYLVTCDGNEKKAHGMLKETLRWRKKYLLPDSSPSETATCAAVCPHCQADPRSHCFLHMGKDAAGRHVVYSCAGRAADKAVAHGMRHMSCEVERIFDGNSLPGQIVWVVDFAGFGLADCNPRVAATALPMFANHYPERFGQIVLFGMPTIFRAIYAASMKILDPVMQRKVLILDNEAARCRYAKRYWHSNPTMAAWLEAAIKCQGVPGSYPDLSLSRCLGDADTRDILERCAAVAAGKKPQH